MDTYLLPKSNTSATSTITNTTIMAATTTTTITVAANSKTYIHNRFHRWVSQQQQLLLLQQQLLLHYNHSTLEWRPIGSTAGQGALPTQKRGRGFPAFRGATNEKINGLL